MKIVLFDYVFERDKPGISGLSDVVWGIAAGLIANEESVHIVGPYSEGTVGPGGAILHPYALPPINYRNIVGHLLIILKGWQVIRKELADADVIHSPEYLSSAVFSLVGSLPVVLTTPGNIHERVHSGANPFDVTTTMAFKLAARVSARRCARINAISNDMKDWWEYSGAPAATTVVIPHGVDTEVFRPITGACSQLGWDSDSRHLLFVGRLSYEKGVDLLLQAFGCIMTRFPRVHLHIVGDGPRRPLYSSMVHQLGLAGRVTFYGWVNKHELPLYYAASDVCVVPSRTEPLGRVVLEAMACQTLVVGARSGGIPDHVREGETGFLFSLEERGGLAEKLQLILEGMEDVRSVASRALEYVQRELTWERIARRICDEVYQPMLAERHFTC